MELFLAVLGASNFTYAEATMTQQSHDWIAIHTRTVESLEGSNVNLDADSAFLAIVAQVARAPFPFACDVKRSVCD